MLRHYPLRPVSVSSLASFMLQSSLHVLAVAPWTSTIPPLPSHGDISKFSTDQRERTQSAHLPPPPGSADKKATCFPFPVVQRVCHRLTSAVGSTLPCREQTARHCYLACEHERPSDEPKHCDLMAPCEAAGACDATLSCLPFFSLSCCLCFMMND